jgi:hypothetical protein
MPTYSKVCLEFLNPPLPPPKKQHKLSAPMEKKFSKTVKNPDTGREKTVKYGQKGSKIGPIGSKRADAYCARSNNIAGDWRSDSNSPNSLSRRKWGCQADKSVKKK